MSSLTSLYKDLLFTHGYVADPALAVSLSPSTPERVAPTRSPAMNFFKSLMYLGGLESVDLRINDDGSPYGPTYGNRLASAQAFGTLGNAPAPREQRPVERRQAPRVQARTATCH